MCMLELPSRASARVCRPLPELSRTQKLAELSATGEASALTATWNWPLVFEMRKPLLPACAAAPTTVAPPLPRRPFQLERSPDSKPSAKRTFE